MDSILLFDTPIYPWWRLERLLVLSCGAWCSEFLCLLDIYCRWRDVTCAERDWKRYFFGNGRSANDVRLMAGRARSVGVHREGDGAG